MQLGKSWFFGIGINRYKHFPNLNNAVKDVKDILKLLQNQYDISPGCILELYDEKATYRNIVQGFDRLENEVGKQDKVLIYYSGHGHLTGKNKREKGFWIPSDAEKDNKAHYIRNSTIRDYFESIDSLHTLLISDACFSGSLFMLGEYRSTLVIDQLEQRPSRWAFCSGRHDEQVYDGKPGGNSPFADSILHVLRNNDQAGLNISGLVEQAMHITHVNYDQLPIGKPLYRVGDKGGQYIFRRKGGGGGGPPPPPPPDDGWWRHWKTIVVIVAALVLAIIVIVKLKSPEPEQPSITLAELKSTIYSPGIDTSNIHFELHGNQVIVSGEVISPQDTGRIMSALRGISEIGEIDNQLTIKQQPPPTSPSPSISVQSNGDELTITITKGAAPFELKLTKDGQEKFSQKLSDVGSCKIDLTKYRADPGKYAVEIKGQNGKSASKSIDIAAAETGTVNDSKGNQYRTIRLNGKEWLAENLNVHVREGSWCYENNRERCDGFGRLYTWETAKAACANLDGGWRLPSDSEWSDLIRIYTAAEDDISEDSKAAYEALKDGGWSGLNLKAGGMRTVEGAFNEFAVWGSYWSNSAVDSNNQPEKAWRIKLGEGEIERNSRNVLMGFSCRCVKD